MASATYDIPFSVVVRAALARGYPVDLVARTLGRSEAEIRRLAIVDADSLTRLERAMMERSE